MRLTRPSRGRGRRTIARRLRMRAYGAARLPQFVWWRLEDVDVGAERARAKMETRRAVAEAMEP